MGVAALRAPVGGSGPRPLKSSVAKKKKKKEKKRKKKKKKEKVRSWVLVGWATAFSKTSFTKGSALIPKLKTRDMDNTLI